MLNSLRLLLILFTATASTASDILLSKVFRTVVLTVWVVISMLVLLMVSVRLLLDGSLFGIFAVIFSIVPVFIYYDLRKQNS